MTAPTPPLAAGPKVCEAIAHTMIGHFATRLEVEAAKQGGSLTALDIRALAEYFLAEEAARFQPTLQRSWDGCTALREAKHWESARYRAFDRILMKSFAHLFPPRQGDDGSKGLLSRRLIPGFKLAVDKMIGPALYEQCQHKSQAILNRHRGPGGSYDWPAIHDDSEARALTNDVLVVVACSFAHFERRREWFSSLVNSHLSTVPATAPDTHWRLSDHGFAELMRALFTGIKADLTANGAGLRRRYGEQTVESVEAFLRRLEG